MVAADVEIIKKEAEALNFELSTAQLPLDANGRLYHLGLKAGERT